MSSERGPDDHELCLPAEVLRHRFRRLVCGDWLLAAPPDGLALPPALLVETVRADIVCFCRVAHACGVGGGEVRRRVGVAMTEAFEREDDGAEVRRWADAARRLVDEIYLLGEHRG